MAERYEVRIPDLGEVDEVDVVEVYVATGDSVARDDSLVSLESDKATMDVPSPEAGTVQEVKVKAGDKVREGSLVLVLELVDSAESAKAKDSESSAAPEPVQPEPAPAEPGKAEPEPKAGIAQETPERPRPEPDSPEPDRTEPDRTEPDRTEPPPHAAEVVSADFSKVYASPAVRRLARELGVDLRQVPGTGRKGRIVQDDVRGYVKTTLAAGPAAAAGAGPGLAAPALPAIDFSKFGEVERQPLTRIQRLSSANLQRSWLTIPHVTQHDVADITELEAFRQEHKARAKEQGFNLTPLALVLKAVVAALQEFPRLNASLDAGGEHIVLKRYFNIGVAVDTADGLIVPVLREVDKKGIFELARELAEVSVQARERKLKPDQLRGGSFTVSSLGGIGGTAFTPIVNWPEVAILGVSRSKTEPVWNGEAFVPRLMLPVSLSYDHRVIDGAMAVRFTRYLTTVLADLRRLLL